MGLRARDSNPLAISQALSAKIDPIKTVDHLKDLIKAKKTNDFQDVDADKLTLWRVSIPDDDDNDFPILFDSVPEKKLKATKLTKVLDAELPEDTIHIIVLLLSRMNLVLATSISTLKRSQTSSSQQKHQLPVFSTRFRTASSFLEFPDPPPNAEDPVPERFQRTTLDQTTSA
ncbi:MAG: hypothetical protein J3R72DRAFT_494472 [Linnemannia gamsii]|nr:MAG: hypothetical protein J3R72DRAFT_494472 [Linnemannia gamsii]